MFKLLNKIIRNNHLTKALQSNKGQVAVIIILVIAIALIFYAVSMNVGRFAETKTTVTIAANTGVAQLASFMASYGQAISWDKLGGNFRKCKKSGVYKALVMFVIAVVLAPFTGGASLLLMLVKITLAALTLYIQAAIIEPGLTQMWNTGWMKLLPPADQYMERGIFAGLQRAATDPGVVPDVNDADQDLVWGFDLATSEPRDEIGRFGFYYGERMKEIAPVDDQPVIDFLCGMENFMYQNPSAQIVAEGCTDTSPDWGLYDPLVTSCDRAECNPCCVPYRIIDLDGNLVDIRPDTCMDYTNDGYWWPICLAGSPYQGGANDYPWVYDRFYENPYNNIPPAASIFVSLREQIGRDDEHHEYYKPDETTPFPWDPNAIPQLPEIPVNEGFYLRDATNYYVPAYFTPDIPENRLGIFPFFHQIADWGVNLTALDTTTRPEHCFWKDSTYEPALECAGIALPQELQTIQGTNFPLPNNPDTLLQNTTWYVDGDNNRTGTPDLPLNPGDPPLAVDKIKLPDDIGLRPILAQDAQCAEDPVANPAVGFWKRGGDRFCSAQWPYSSGCAKHGACQETDPSTGTIYTIDCQCGDPGAGPADLWYDDALDELIYGIPVFLEWAEDLLTQWRANPNFAASEFEVWYQGASEWIEPGTDPPPAGNNATQGTPGNPVTATTCFICNPQNGWLLVWRDKILEMKARLEAWRDASFEGASCDEVWCIPPPACFSGGDSSALGGAGPESNTFDSNGNSIRGDITDIVACLDWNVNDVGGNAVKFQTCETLCGQCLTPPYTDCPAADNWCGSRPRSLIPGLDAFAYIAANINGLLDCRDGALPGECPALLAACGGNPVCEAAQSCGGYLCTSTLLTEISSRVAASSCNNGGFRAMVQQSIPEAQNQVAKFRQRQEFLNNRLTQLNDILVILDEAYNQFEAFLTCDDGDTNGEPDGPACKLIKDRINYQFKPSGLPYEAIYAWQSEPSGNRAPPYQNVGYWHIVKVEGRIPRRCDTFCGVSWAQNSDPSWPRVRTYTKGFLGSTRCYEMASTDGLVKFRVTRFDEDRDPALLMFPNGVPIWDFRFFHPRRGPSPVSVPNLGNICQNSMVADPPGLPVGVSNIYQGAFQMTKYRVDPDPDLDNTACWNAVTEILSRGVVSESCAQYYWHEGMRHGMSFRYIPCQEF